MYLLLYREKKRRKKIQSHYFLTLQKCFISMFSIKICFYLIEVQFSSRGGKEIMGLNCDTET